MDAGPQSRAVGRLPPLRHERAPAGDGSAPRRRGCPEVVPSLDQAASRDTEGPLWPTERTERACLALISTEFDGSVSKSSQVKDLVLRNKRPQNSAVNPEDRRSLLVGTHSRVVANLHRLPAQDDRHVGPRRREQRLGFVR